MNSFRVDLLRAARLLLGYSQVAAETRFKLKPQSIHLLEAGKYKLLPRNGFLIKELYERDGVEFLEASDGKGPGVRWKSPDLGTSDPFRSALFRAARGLIDISQRKLAADAGIDPSFIARLEKNSFRSVNDTTLQTLENALLQQDVELTSATRSFGPGVRWTVD